jgi:hypothetical protein
MRNPLSTGVQVVIIMGFCVLSACKETSGPTLPTPPDRHQVAQPSVASTSGCWFRGDLVQDTVRTHR